MWIRGSEIFYADNELGSFWVRPDFSSGSKALKF